MNGQQISRLTFARLHLIAYAVLWQALTGSPVYGADPAVPSEYAVKAAFIFNFAKFTEWPTAASGATRGQIVLCAFVGAPYGAALAAIDGKSVQGRIMRVRRGVRPDEIKSCHMMFIAEPEERRIPELLRVVKGSPVLTVGDVDGFAEAGGMIGLINADNRVQFEINNEAAQRANLKISSQLLRLARLVKER
ncbi:MAG: YfiR family protein [Betaproteobacteria bacterium]|nr:YfiR family protein [Betaproteobacteria bacterium]MBI3056178.1 YfiR family protein [Betaproteobacteria bacterium]